MNSSFFYRQLIKILNNYYLINFLDFITNRDARIFATFLLLHEKHFYFYSKIISVNKCGMDQKDKIINNKRKVKQKKKTLGKRTCKCWGMVGVGVYYDKVMFEWLKQLLLLTIVHYLVRFEFVWSVTKVFVFGRSIYVDFFMDFLCLYFYSSAQRS